MGIFGNGYQPQYPAQYIPPVPQYNVTENGIIWVQGESGAKSYPVQNGKNTVLFDSESERFFIKSVDINGIPQKLRIFEYHETVEDDSVKTSADMSNYITRDEFNAAIEKLMANPDNHYNNQNNNNQNRKGNKNGKSSF